MTYYTDDANEVEYDMDEEIDNLTSYRMELAWEALERSRKEQEVKIREEIHIPAPNYYENYCRELPKLDGVYSSPIDGCIEKIIVSITETIDDIICKVCTSFFNEKEQIKINKQLLVDALIEYRQNHPERFEEGEQDAGDKELL